MNEQSTKRVKELQQIFTPDIYILTLNKGKKPGANLVTLESIIKLAPLLGIEIKSILNGYFIIVLTLVYGVQVKLNSKLTIDKNVRNTSIEKVFQQTTAHYNTTKIISNASIIRTVLIIICIQWAIDLDAFGNIESERTEEGFKEAIEASFEDLSENKGSGTSKVSLKNPETRNDAIRAKMASIRSKWCSIPTYGTNKLASPGVSIKGLSSETLLKYCDKISDKLIEDGIITVDNKPSKDYILNGINEIKTELRIPNEIDDSSYGTFTIINLEKDIFGFERNNISSNLSKEPVPDFINQYKSKTNTKRTNNNNNK